MLGTWGANLCRFSLVSVGKNILISANSKKLISVSRRFGPPPGVLQRLLRDVACFGAGSFSGVAVSHPLQRTRADDMSHDVDQSDTAPGAAAALMRERVRTPLP